MIQYIRCMCSIWPIYFFSSNYSEWRLRRRNGREGARGGAAIHWLVWGSGSPKMGGTGWLWFQVLESSFSYVVQFIHLCGSFYSFTLFILLLCAFISSFLAFVSSFYDFHFFLLCCCFLSFIMWISMLYSITCIMDSQIVMTPYWILIYVNYEVKHIFFKVLMFVVIYS